MRTMYTRGREYKLRVKRILERMDYVHVIRSAGSQGSADFIASNSSKIVIVQVKKRDVGRHRGKN